MDSMLRAGMRDEGIFRMVDRLKVFELFYIRNHLIGIKRIRVVVIPFGPLFEWDLRICTIIKIVGQDQRIFRDSCLQFIGQRRFAGARSSRNANHKRRTVQSLIPPQSKISCKRRLGT